MTLWGIRHQVLLLAVVPTLTVSILLVAYFTSSRLQDLEQSFHERGQAIAEKLANSAEYGVFFQNPGLVHDIALSGLKEHDVKSVSCYTSNGSEIVSVGERTIPFNPKILGQKPNLRVQILTQEADNSLSIVVPIKSYQEMDAMHSDLSQVETLIGWLQIELDSTAIHLREYQVLIHTGIILLFGLSISGLHALQMGRNVTRPILELSEAIQRIKDGDFSTRVQTTSYHEITNLESGINTMAEALQNAKTESLNKINQATLNLRRSLETIEVQNLELELAKQTAENASKIKSEFLADMSHEIRTPLNALIGFIHLMKKTTLNEKQSGYILTLEKSASTLLSIINDILDFSKIEAGKLKLEQSPMDIRDCVSETLNLMTPHANEKGLMLIPLIYSDVPKQILADALRIKQVLNNLVSNAIKFTENGSIVVRVMVEKALARQTTIRVSVTDTGIGLSEKEQKELFQAFNQVNIETTRKFGGTGLGLVICKKLVEQMKGSIGVESTPNKGTTFWFTFLADNTQRHGQDIENNRFVGSTFNQSLSHLKVLAVDDNEDNLKLIQTLLEEMEIKVTSLSSGFEALAAIQAKNTYDLILMDVRMPEMDGIQTTHAIRAFEKAKALTHTPIIALTAHAFISEREALLNSGIDDYLMKPIEEPALINLLQKWTRTTNAGNATNVSNVINASNAKNASNATNAINKTNSTDTKESSLSGVLTGTALPGTDLPAVDWALALKRVNGKEDLALELFEKLLKGLEQEKKDINQCFLTKDWQKMRDQVHKLHGACCYCGVPELKHCVQKLESALATQTVDIIQPRLLAFNKAVTNLLAAEITI